jgi:putative OPT family oligopeptide transporter
MEGVCMNEQPGSDMAHSAAELTLTAILLGILFGIVFGAANAYLGLAAGLTISTAIPVSVMTLAAFRLVRFRGRRGTLLEANMSQTIGSASSSLASGMIFTVPALFLWELEPSFLQMVLLALCGGMIGVLMMIPLRPYLIEQEHGRLPYPEGTACAKVLVASEVGGPQANHVFRGLGVGLVFKLMVDGLHLVPGKLRLPIPLLPKAELGSKLSPALLGVGYILGPRISLIMVGGGFLSWLVLIPVIAIWGAGRVTPLYPETALAIPEMSASLIWSRYVRYIGAGAVAAGGLVTLLRSIPTMLESFRIGVTRFKERFRVSSPEPVYPPRQDLSYRLVSGLLLLPFLVLIFIPPVFPRLDGFGARFLAAGLILVGAFFFVTVSSRIVGLIGVTSNPTSGMTLATLLYTTGVFLLLGWTGDRGKVTAVAIGCVVAVATCIAGDTSQALKTGYLLGAVPRKQEIGKLIGVLSSAISVCLTIFYLHRAYAFGTEALPAPQATLMKVVVEGVLERNLPWFFVGLGVIIALLCVLMRIPPLPFAVGVYLPVSTMVPVILGGLLRYQSEQRAPNTEIASLRRERGVLFGSGLVGGEGLLGVGIAAVAVIQRRAPAGVGYAWAGVWAPLLGFLAFAALAVFFWRTVVRGGQSAGDP